MLRSFYFRDKSFLFTLRSAAIPANGAAALIPAPGGQKGASASTPMPQVPSGGGGGSPIIAAIYDQVSQDIAALSSPAAVDSSAPSLSNMEGPQIQLASWGSTALGGVGGIILGDHLREELLRRSPLLREYDCKVGAGVGWGLDTLSCPPAPPSGLMLTERGRELYQTMMDDMTNCHREAGNQLERAWKDCKNPPQAIPQAPTPKTEPPPPQKFIEI